MKSARPRISVVIPARNEAALIGSTVESVLRARDRYSRGDDNPVEIIVVDNASDDGTADALARHAAGAGVLVASCEPLGAARARNLGAGLSNGRILVFLDADTHLPTDALVRVAELIDDHDYEAGITLLGALDGGLRARCWWAFWNAVRRLPLPRAKAMPACMFCTRAAFDEFGPFDERVALGEEWPILAGLYRARPRRFIYDHTITALSSGRRMELQRFGYARTFARYAWAVLSVRGRVDYPDDVRHSAADSTVVERRPGFGRWSAWLGRQFGRIRLHAIEHRQVAGQPMIAKRRRWFGRMLIGPVNLCLRKSGVRVLPVEEWQARERALHRAIHGIELEAGPPDGLILPRWPGMVLDEYARDRLAPATDRLRGLRAASLALQKLHHADGTSERLSHGDATLRNVLFDPNTVEARWFDFDTAHESGLDADWRHGDDLRALLYSAVESFDDVPVVLVFLAVRDAYDDPVPWEHVRDRLARGVLHRSPMHFAQTCPPEARLRELERLLAVDQRPSDFAASLKNRTINPGASAG